MDLRDLAMSSRVTAGPAANFDPRWKLAAVAGAVAATLLIRGLAGASLALAASIVLAAWARLPLRWVGTRLGMVIPFLALFTLPLPFLIHDQGPSWEWSGMRFSLRGATVALLLLAKALTILFLVLFVLGTAPLDAILNAARALGVPGLFVYLVLLSNRYVFVLGEELARLRIALRVRGFRNRADRHSYRTIGHVAGTLLVRGHERAERVAQAMRCRGFDGRFRSLTAFHTTARDVVLFLLIAIAAILVVVLDWFYR